MGIFAPPPEKSSHDSIGKSSFLVGNTPSFKWLFLHVVISVFWGVQIGSNFGMAPFLSGKKNASRTRLCTQCPDESTNQGPNPGGSVGRMADGWVFSVVRAWIDRKWYIWEPKTFLFIGNPYFLGLKKICFLKMVLGPKEYIYIYI